MKEDVIEAKNIGLQSGDSPQAQMCAWFGRRRIGSPEFAKKVDGGRGGRSEVGAPLLAVVGVEEVGRGSSRTTLPHLKMEVAEGGKKRVGPSC